MLRSLPVPSVVMSGRGSFCWPAEALRSESPMVKLLSLGQTGNERTGGVRHGKEKEKERERQRERDRESERERDMEKRKQGRSYQARRFGHRIRERKRERERERETNRGRRMEVKREQYLRARESEKGKKISATLANSFVVPSSSLNDRYQM